MSEETNKKKLKLVRGLDGRMRPASDSEDIGEVWQTQKKIRTEESSTQATQAHKRPQDTPKPKVVKPSTNATTAASPVKEIAISLSLPKVPKASLSNVKEKLSSVPRWKYGVAALVLTPVIIIGAGVLGGNGNGANKTEVQGTQQAATPDFSPLLPNGDITNTVSQKVQYDANKKVANYTDKIDGTSVTISLQQLPATFKPDIATNIKKVAEQFSANDKLEVDNGDAFIGTSEKGPQSLVGYRGDLLVFMKSEAKIDNASWVAYFNSLK